MNEEKAFEANPPSFDKVCEGVNGGVSIEHKRGRTEVPLDCLPAARHRLAQALF